PVVCPPKDHLQGIRCVQSGVDGGADAVVDQGPLTINVFSNRPGSARSNVEQIATSAFGAPGQSVGSIRTRDRRHPRIDSGRPVLGVEKWQGAAAFSAELEAAILELTHPL